MIVDLDPQFGIHEWTDVVGAIDDTHRAGFPCAVAVSGFGGPRVFYMRPTGNAARSALYEALRWCARTDAAVASEWRAWNQETVAQLRELADELEGT